MENQDIVTHAICQFTGKHGDCITDHGYAIIIYTGNTTSINLNLYNLPPGEHGFHVHEYADMRNGCKSLGSHYNPFYKDHGGLYGHNRHIGDLGNITVNNLGKCTQRIVVDYLPISGQHGILGRSIVIHEKPDDYGLGGHEDSLSTGNSGERIACGVIGRI